MNYVSSMAPCSQAVALVFSRMWPLLTRVLLVVHLWHKIDPNTEITFKLSHCFMNVRAQINAY